MSSRHAFLAARILRNCSTYDSCTGKITPPPLVPRSQSIEQGSPRFAYLLSGSQPPVVMSRFNWPVLAALKLQHHGWRCRLHHFARALFRTASFQVKGLIGFAHALCASCCARKPLQVVLSVKKLGCLHTFCSAALAGWQPCGWGGQWQAVAVDQELDCALSKGSGSAQSIVLQCTRHKVCSRPLPPHHDPLSIHSS